MPLYNFQERFVPYIEDGSKPHTMRAIRKHPAKPGDTLYLYTGLRSRYKKAKRIIEPKICTAVVTFFITSYKGIFFHKDILKENDAVYVLERLERKQYSYSRLLYLPDKTKDVLAWHDGFRYDSETFGNPPFLYKGFKCFQLMFRFWQIENTIPFAGHLICWHQNPQELPYLKLVTEL